MKRFTVMGFSILEVVVVVGICATILVPVLTLSTQSVTDQQEILERALASGLCLDAVERLKRYKPYWPLPGTPRRPGVADGPPLAEMFMPVELDPTQAGMFDQSYLEHIRFLGMKLNPKVERTPVASLPGLFRLTVSTRWTNSKGHAREVTISRYCFAP